MGDGKVSTAENLMRLANRLDGYIEFRERRNDIYVHGLKDIPQKLRDEALVLLGVRTLPLAKLSNVQEAEEARSRDA